MAISPEESDELLRFLKPTESKIDDLVMKCCRVADIPVIVTTIKKELRTARRAVDVITPGIEKTEKERRIAKVEEKFLEWEKGRTK
jgi:hypothetical protein